jgi:hypothetical protein
MQPIQVLAGLGSTESYHCISVSDRGRDGDTYSPHIAGAIWLSVQSGRISGPAHITVGSRFGSVFNLVSRFSFDFFGLCWFSAAFCQVFATFNMIFIKFEFF